MKITVIDTGYMGLAPGTCLAELGNTIFYLDVYQAKIDLLNHGEISNYEPVDERQPPLFEGIELRA